MATGIQEVFEALRHQLETTTGLDVAVMAGSQPQAALLLFPYRMSETGVHQQQPGVRPGAAAPLPIQVDFLMLAGEGTGIGSLDVGVDALHQNPVLSHGETRVRIALNELSVETLAAVFSSAGVPLRLAAAYRAEWVS